MAKSIKLKNDLYIDGSNIRIPNVNIGRTLNGMLVNWGTTAASFTNQLNELKQFCINNCQVGMTIINCSFNGAHYIALLEKASDSYMSFVLFNYSQFTHYKYYNGTWAEITLNDVYVNRGYLGYNPNINNLRAASGIYGLYSCSQAPNGAIGTLEVIVYSGDWVVQRFTDIENHKMWERYFTYGTTWSSWIQRW